MQITQNLFITYSNQKARNLKESKITQPLDKVTTLDNFILELYEQNEFKTIIDKIVGSGIISHIIQSEKIAYFNYLKSDSDSLKTIFSFLLKCSRNDVEIETIVKGKEKLRALKTINSKYVKYKKHHHLVDIADIEDYVLSKFDSIFKNTYKDIHVDSFQVENICYIKSKKQEQILKKFSIFKTIKSTKTESLTTKIIKPSSEVFDNIDEIKTTLRITRKLLEDGVKSSEILIVASDIQEYAPLYKLFLDEYELKGYSSTGTPLSSFYNSHNKSVKIALLEYKTKIASMESLYKKLGLTLTEKTQENIKNSISIVDDKIGIEITEPNQIVGLDKSYEHIIFVGTDINHFPPRTSDNFLYTYEDDINYFYSNNYFKSSQTQLNELKRLSENLYIITATYNGKRELTPSILLDGVYDGTIDICDIKSLNQLALIGQTQTPDSMTEDYYKSILSREFTIYDGKKVEGLNAAHLSASQINKYLSCPLAYLLSNKLKLQAPNRQEEGFDVMEQGSLMHLCYELFGRYIKEHKITSTDVDELYKIMFDISIEAYNHKDTREPKYSEPMVENIHHKIFLNTLQAGLQDERTKGLLAKFVDYYIVNAKDFNYFKDTEFEKEFALDSELKPYKLKDKNDKNYFIKGFIDRFDNLDKHVNIVDYKSKKVKGKDKEKQAQIDEYKDIQLALYLLFTKQEHPKKTLDAHLLSFKGNDRGVAFASMQDIDEQKLKELIFDVKKEIENGEYSFDNSDEKVCGWCDMKFICHEGVLGKINKKER